MADREQVDPEDVPEEFDRGNVMSYVRLTKEKGALIGGIFLIVTTVLMILILSQTSSAKDPNDNSNPRTNTSSLLFPNH